MVGYTSKTTQRTLESRRRVRCLKLTVVESLRDELVRVGLKLSEKPPLFRISGCGYFVVEIGRSVQPRVGNLHWIFSVRKNCPKYRCIVVRLTADNLRIQDFVLLERVPKRSRTVTFTNGALKDTPIYQQMQELVTAITNGRLKTKRKV